MTLEACRARYDELYEETLAQARAHAVSAEIPLPREAKRTAFGLEVRPLHDFACIEGNVRKLGRLIADLRYPAAPDQYCQYLWRSAGLKSTTRSDGAADPTHYLYPCLGPLANVDLSRQTAFDFSGAEGFRRVWRHPVLAGLRHGQHRPGVSPVCDACRATDTRDPARYPELDRLVADFQRALVELPVAGGDATADQPGGISR
jgi:hypothetical protein